MRSTPCKKSCCWSPYACAKARNCPCHIEDRTMAEIERFNATSQRARAADQSSSVASRVRPGNGLKK